MSENIRKSLEDAIQAYGYACSLPSYRADDKAQRRIAVKAVTNAWNRVQGLIDVIMEEESDDSLS